MISHKLLLEALADGVFIAQDYQFKFCNPALPAMLGYDDHEFLGLHFNKVIAPEFLELWTDRYNQRTGDGKEPENCYEVQFLCKDGSPLWVELRANRSEFNNRSAVQGIIRDISQRKKSEAIQQQLQLESEVGKALVSIADSLQGSIGEELHESLGQLLSGALYQAGSLKLHITPEDQQSLILANKLIQLLQESITECRSLSEGLGPILLRTQGLSEAIYALAGKFSATYGITCAVDGSLEKPLHDTFKELQIYRITQEILSTSIKYHDATVLSITLLRNRNDITIEIKTNQSIQQCSVNKDFGRSQEGSSNIIRYRAGLIGAEITSQTNPDGGAMHQIKFSK